MTISQILIRPYIPSDAPRLAQIFVEAVRAYPPASSSKDEKLRR